MSNFVFALNATMPVFLVILLGWFLRRIGMLGPGFCRDANLYVFRVALPVSLFNSISTMDLYSDFSLSFCLFCALATAAFFLGVWGLAALLMKDRRMIGAFAQASCRSSAAILGIAFATNIYGDAGLVPMMIVAAVPLYNIFAVLILSFSPQVDENGALMPPAADGKARVRKACLDVLKNPIIIGILLGIPFALLRVTLPEMLTGALKSVGGTASPVALLVVGASFSGGEALQKWKPAVASTVIKLFVLPLVFLPIAVWLGFRNSALVAILIMTGSPTTVAAYVMARQMHGDGVLTSNVVLLSTLVSSVSITLWLFALRSFALI